MQFCAHEAYPSLLGCKVNKYQLLEKSRSFIRTVHIFHNEFAQIRSERQGAAVYDFHHEKIAIRKLKDCNWNVEVAVDAFYNDQTPTTTTTTNTTTTWNRFTSSPLAQGVDVEFKKPMAFMRKLGSFPLEGSWILLANKKSIRITRGDLKSIFRLKIILDKDEDAILVDGILQYCNDLQVAPEDIVMLVIAWNLECEKMCEFKRQGFINGWTKLKCDSIEKMRAAIPRLRQSLRDEATFREIYQFTFKFGLGDNQKSLNLDIAIEYWQLLLRDRWQHLDIWVEFIKEKHGKSISKDTWNLDVAIGHKVAFCDSPYWDIVPDFVIKIDYNYGILDCQRFEGNIRIYLGTAY
ncbi:hypothetical protein G9A89_019098 [Geosiphon pyriformis]|nr:hypothetical protein G9A89_019098 [Geosiphon pyriformis]